MDARLALQQFGSPEDAGQARFVKCNGNAALTLSKAALTTAIKLQQNCNKTKS
jgi:hypothetical protein